MKPKLPSRIDIIFCTIFFLFQNKKYKIKKKRNKTVTYYVFFQLDLIDFKAKREKEHVKTYRRDTHTTIELPNGIGSATSDVVIFEYTSDQPPAPTDGERNIHHSLYHSLLLLY